MTRLLVAEPNVGGHRGEHLEWIAEAWRERAEPGRLVLAAPPALFDEHPALARSGAALHPVRHWPEAGSARQRGRDLRRLLEEHRPTDTLLTSAEHFMAALALRTRLPEGARISAIAFRPTLHYGALGSPPTSAKERALRAAKRQATRAMLRHPAFCVLFSLDEAAAPALSALTPGARALALPDPVPEEPIHDSREAVHEGWGVERGRTVALLAGGLSERKGSLALLRALPLVPRPEAARLAVVFAGAVPAASAGAFHRLRARAEATPVQIVVQEGHVPAGRLQTLIAAADVVLAPYQHHVGSSGFLMRAAGAGVPVISQDWGAMGHVVRTHGLGRAVDTASPRAIAQALAEAVRDPHEGFRPEAAALFARAHTVRTFTDRLLDTLLAP